MQIKLTRDQCRSVQNHFFPYLVQVCAMKVDHPADSEELLTNKIIVCILQEIRIIFERKLLTKSNNFLFRFSDAQGIIFYKLLMNLPLQADRFWLINLRSFICDRLHLQMCEPV